VSRTFSIILLVAALAILLAIAYANRFYSIQHPDHCDLTKAEIRSGIGCL
jgi:hypothetical protein